MRPSTRRFISSAISRSTILLSPLSGRSPAKSSVSQNNVAAYTTYGTSRANAYKILEDSLNLRDVRIYDTIEDADGKERRVLNAKETTLAAQKQQAIRDAFKDWIWKDPDRRQALVRQYNEEMNSTRPREYDGGHITFGGMNPAITLREHQKKRYRSCAVRRQYAAGTRGRRWQNL